MDLAEYCPGRLLPFFDHGRGLFAWLPGGGWLHALSLLALRVAGTSPADERVGQAVLHGHLCDPGQAFRAPGHAHRQHVDRRGYLSSHLSHRPAAELSPAGTRGYFSAWAADSLSAFFQRAYGNPLCLAGNDRAVGISVAAVSADGHDRFDHAHRSPGGFRIHRPRHRRPLFSPAHDPYPGAVSNIGNLELRRMGAVWHGLPLVHQMVAVAAGKLAVCDG